MFDRFRGSWWPRFAAAVLLELLFYYISSATGHLVLIFFGAAFAAASLGLLQGFFVALLIGVLGFAGGVLFLLVRGIYQQQMIRTYGAVAHNFVEAAAKRRSTASSFRASARFTSTRTTSSAI